MGDERFHLDRFILCGFAMAVFTCLAVLHSAWWVFGVVFFAFFCGLNIGILMERLEETQKARIE